MELEMHRPHSGSPYYDDGEEYDMKSVIDMLDNAITDGRLPFDMEQKIKTDSAA